MGIGVVGRCGIGVEELGSELSKPAEKAPNASLHSPTLAHHGLVPKQAEVDDWDTVIEGVGKVAAAF